MKKLFLRLASLTLALLMLLTSSGLAETLRFPDRSPAVVRLQQALTQIGYYSGTIDGQFGTGTRAAVEAFQLAYGLKVDGVAGAATQQKLYELTGIQISTDSAVANPPAADPDVPAGSANGIFKGDYTRMIFGSSGERVRILQRALIALGYGIMAVDGDYGTTTYTAVKEFQATVGLTADGKAGEKTLKKLESYFDSEGNVITGPIVTDPPASDENLQYGIPVRTLRKGMSGLDVQYTQARLKALKYYTGAEDGQFGSGMQKAVKAFQTKNGLKSDGVVGPGTREVLFSAGAIAADEVVQNPETHRTLRLGMKGDDVAALQTRLAVLGYYTMAVDGQYGTGTVRAVKAFQARNNLKADGVCGEETAAAIYSSDAIDAGSTITNPPAPESSAVPTRTLELGDRGEDVASVQNRLKALGYYNKTVDGQYGSGTVSAVKFFQARNALTVDGKVGPRTRAVLYSNDAIAAGNGGTATNPPTTEPSGVPSKTLRYGDRGDDVVLLQVRLIALGYLRGNADGIFGAKTKTAVQSFQLRNGLTADGVAGTKTYRKMFSSDAVPSESAGGLPTTGIPSRNLYEGCTGDDVRTVQTRLKALGYLAVVDGTYGPQTTEAMKVFQQRNGLAGTGVGNTATYNILFSTNAIPYEDTGDNNNSTDTYRTLRLGMTGTDVLRLQQMLQSLKYNVNVTGTYDEMTYTAVAAFQRRNGLAADGVAGKLTQSKLYSGHCVTGDTVLPNEGAGGAIGNGGGPGSVSQVQLLHWYDDIKGVKIKNGNELLVYEPASNSSYYVRVYSQGQHCDAEPVTAEDVATMIAAWGGSMSWNEKPVYVRLPNGTWCIASTHSMAHEENWIANNNFDGHICIHFPRTMTECIANAPKNGVRHQNDIRKHWKAITGQDIPW